MSNSVEDAKNNDTEEDNVGGFTVLDEVGEGHELYSPSKEHDESGDDTFRISDEMLNDLESITNQVNFTEDDQHIKDEEESNLEDGEVSCVDEYQDDNENGAEDITEIKSDKGDQTVEDKVEDEDEDDGSNSHPYLYLIDTFEFPPDLVSLSTIGEVKKIEQKTFFMVNSKAQLERMLQSLRTATEIGVDLQISKKEYKAPVCFMEISTKDVNYVIDALKLRYELLLLTEIFINPKIVKIIYSADIILKEFQQKLNLYMINIFDVKEARNRVLDKQEPISFFQIIKNEYAYDPKNVVLDATTRPLSNEMKLFCQTGVHYLLYIYHNYKNKLISKNMGEYKIFLEWCRNACKKIHKDSGKDLLKQFENELKNRHSCELEVLKKLFVLGQELAKKYNVRPDAVIGKRVMMRIVKDLPDQEADIILKSRYIKEEKHKILKFIRELKARYNIFDRSLLKKKVINKPPPRQNPPNRQQKRKINDKHDAVPSKQKYMAPHSKNNQSRQRRTRFSDMETNNFQKNNQPQNFNIPTPLFSQNLPPTNPFMNFSNPNQMNNMRTHPEEMYNNKGFRSNTNMGNLPNAASTNQFRSTPFQFSAAPGQMNFEKNNSSNEDGLYNRLVNLQQVRDNIQRKHGHFANNFGSTNSRDMRDIDSKITQLEREVHDIQSKNQRRRSNDRSSDNYRRRY